MSVTVNITTKKVSQCAAGFTVAHLRSVAVIILAPWETDQEYVYGPSGPQYSWVASGFSGKQGHTVSASPPVRARLQIGGTMSCVIRASQESLQPVASYVTTTFLVPGAPYLA